MLDPPRPPISMLFGFVLGTCKILSVNHAVVFPGVTLFSTLRLGGEGGTEQNTQNVIEFLLAKYFPSTVPRRIIFLKKTVDARGATLTCKSVSFHTRNGAVFLFYKNKVLGYHISWTSQAFMFEYVSLKANKTQLWKIIEVWGVPGPLKTNKNGHGVSLDL